MKFDAALVSLLHSERLVFAQLKSDIQSVAHVMDGMLSELQRCQLDAVFQLASLY